MSPPRAILIAGPTASGKSALALDLAERLGGTVVNADSMQVYQELRILTARPTPAEEARAPHRLYGHVPASQAYSVGHWLTEAQGALAEAERAGRLPILVGGTGLYFKALLEGLAPIPDVPEPVRAHWRAEAKRLGGPGLHALLTARDPRTAARLRPSDPQRLTRALEVLSATGRGLSDWQRQTGSPVLKASQTARLVLSGERGTLYARIDARFEAMLAAGALDEAARLAGRGLDPALPAMRAHGVPPLAAHLRGEIDRATAIERAQGDTRHYAKRQLTWARRNMIAWQWHVEQDMEKLTEKIFAMIDA